MIQTASIADNVSDVLVKIIYFTQLRRRVLHANIDNAGHPDLTPQDLPVQELAEALSVAVAEHLQSHRLLFRDTANIQFGPNNTMKVWPVADSRAHELLQTDRDEYMEYQVNKLLENCLNRRVAEELLRQKCGTYTPPADWDHDKSRASDQPSGNLLADHNTSDQ
jgi:hypothetical protein